MKRLLLLSTVAVLLPSLVLAQDKTKSGDKPKADGDSAIVKKTREKLETKITVDYKDERLEDVLKDLKKQLEGELSYTFETGVSRNQAFSYSAKDKPVKDILDEMFKGRGLGFVIGRKMKEGDRYEGWLVITQGEERGDPIVKGAPGKTETKPTPPPATTAKPAEPKKPSTPKEAPDDQEEKEKRAAGKLKQAKNFLDVGLRQDAIDYLEQIVKNFPNTKAAEEAKPLLEKIKK